MSDGTRILVETFVPAPPEAVYMALLNPEVHAATASGRERVVDVSPSPGPFLSRHEPSAKGRGVLFLGDEVTFEATHFLIRQRLTARITLVDPPHAFEDTMVRGFFREFWHRHEFHAEADGTRMVDEVRFRSPLGGLFDRWVVGPYLRRFLEHRGQALAQFLSTPNPLLSQAKGGDG